MKINIVDLATLIGALSVIGTAIIALLRFYDNSKNQSQQIKHIKNEQTLTMYALRACLDGLHQQGCNGRVTEALEKIDKYINQAAHDEN